MSRCCAGSLAFMNCVRCKKRSLTRFCAKRRRWRLSLRESLCYQELPALLVDGLTVVVSPLIALMQDQVEQLQALGVAAAF